MSNNISVYYNGVKQSYSNSISIGNKAFLPLKELFETQEYKVVKTNNEIVCTKKSTTIKFKIKENLVLRDQSVFDLGDNLLLDGNRYMIGLTMIKTLLNVDASFNKTNNKVLINDVKTTPYDWVENNKFIAHALGSIEGNCYTNCLEAFKFNYSNGYKVFEADLVLTSDGKLVLKHDWTSYLSKVFGQEIADSKLDKPLSFDEFIDMKVHKHLTPISFEDLVKLMASNKDIYIVTDTKEIDKDIINNQFQEIISVAKKYDPNILKRIIPQIYNEDMYKQLQEMYKFDSYIYTLYMTNSTNEQVIDFMTKNNLKVATMPTYRATNEFTMKLKEKGIYTYTHTVNSLQDVKDFEKIGVYGFYTDFITPSYYRTSNVN